MFSAHSNIAEVINQIPPPKRRLILPELRKYLHIRRTL